MTPQTKNQKTHGRTAGSKNRNYPPLKLADALAVATAIQDQASGMTVSRLTLAELLGISPGSSNLSYQVAASRMYGLTNGGINATEFSLTPLGQEATGADEVTRVAAYKRAVMNVEPYKRFFQAFAGKKVPGPMPFREYLANSAGVDRARAEECAAFILADAETAGLVRSLGGGQYVDLAVTPSAAPAAPSGAAAENGSVSEQTLETETPPPLAQLTETQLDSTRRPAKPKKVFIAHGKNRVPLDQLKTALDTFKVIYAVAVDEPNQGRPISKKVASLMRDECSSGVFIFTADERFLREGKEGTTEEVGRTRENVAYELGAASILYENRIVIFKEKGVTFPTDFSDLGYIEFEKDKLVAELGSLFKELVALDILEVRAKG